MPLGIKIPTVFRRNIRDAATSAAIFVVAAIVGTAYVNQYGDYARFEQSEWRAAVMLALGKGFVDVNPRDIPGLDDFLGRRISALTVSKNDLHPDIRLLPPNQFQQQQRYVMYAAALLWRISDTISWKALAPLYGLLYGIVAIFSFLVFRLLLSYPLAVVGALLMVSSPTNLYFLPHLRDYSKAPGILAAVFVLGHLVKCRPSRMRAWMLCLFLGAFLGINMGFRKDVVIGVPVALFVLFFLVYGRPWEFLKDKLIAASILLAAFYGFSYPIWSGMRQEGNNASHVIIYGLLPPFDDFFGIGGVNYELAPTSNDHHAYYNATAYAERKTDEELAAYGTSDYDKECDAFLIEYAKTVPADLILRLYAAVLRQFDYGLFVSSQESRYGVVRIPVIEHLFNLRFDTLFWLAYVQRCLLVFCFLFLASRSVPYGLAFAFFVLYFCGYTALQYDLRHRFHLEILTWLPPLFFIECIMTAASAARQERLTGILSRCCHWKSVYRSPSLRRMGICLITIVPLLVTPLAFARIYQNHSLTALFAQYQKDAAKPLRIETASSIPESTELARLSIVDPEAIALENMTKPCYVYSRFLVAEFDSREDIPITIRYSLSDNVDTFHNCVIPRTETADGGSLTRYFFSVYETGDLPFFGKRSLESIEMWSSQKNLLKGVSAVKDADAIPLWMNVTLPDNWETLPKCKTLKNSVPPLYFRGRTARSGNLLENGDFREWTGEVPNHFNGKSPHFILQKEMQYPWSGKNVVRQTWIEPDGVESIFKLFGANVYRLRPSTPYELIVNASNLSTNDLVLCAWQVYVTEDGKMDLSKEVTRLKYMVMRVKPCPAYSEYNGTFTTGPDPRVAVILCAASNGPEFPATVLWRDWRLAEWKGQWDASPIN